MNDTVLTTQRAAWIITSTAQEMRKRVVSRHGATFGRCGRYPSPSVTPADRLAYEEALEILVDQLFGKAPGVAKGLALDAATAVLDGELGAFEAAMHIRETGMAVAVG